MRIIVRPLSDPQREIDLTDRLVAAIAEELWRLYGGNDRLNWLEAERHLAAIVGQARADAPETAVLVAPPTRRPAGPGRGAGARKGPRQAPRDLGRSASQVRSLVPAA
jgi:hypothetical protein